MNKITTAGEHLVSELTEFLLAQSCQPGITFFYMMNCQFWPKFWYV